MAAQGTYFFRLCRQQANDDLFVPLVLDPKPFVLRTGTLVPLVDSVVPLEDHDALAGACFENGSAAFVRDLRQGRAKDIAYLRAVTSEESQEEPYWITLAATETHGSGYLLHVVYAENSLFQKVETRLKVSEHAERIREALIRISPPVYGIRIEDVQDKYPYYPSPSAQVLVSAALFRILNPLAPVSDQDTVYVVSHKALTEWKPS